MSGVAPSPAEARRRLYERVDFLCPGSEDDTRRLAVELALHSGSRVLELGCGTGRTACQLAREVGCRVVATDLDPLMLDLTLARAQREGVADRLEIRMADLRTLFAFFPEGGFDAVYAEAAVHHLGIAPLAAEARRLLRREGTLAFSALTWRALDEAVPESVATGWRRAHPLLFGGPADWPIPRLEPALNELADAGFHKGFAYEVEEQGWNAYARNLAAALEAYGAEGLRSEEADHLFEGLGLALEQGLAHAGFYVYGGFPDEG